MNDRRKTDAYREDEISLVDVWRTLVKHKKLIFLVWGLITLTGLAAAVLMPEKYAYTTLIEVGGQGNDLVGTADAARTRLIAGIIPVVQRKYLDEGKKITDVKVLVPEKSPSNVLLESQGTAKAASSHLAFHGAIVDVLRDGHRAIQNKTRETLTVQQEAAQRRIAALKDESTLLTAKLKRLDEEEEYLKGQIKQSQADVAAASKLGAKSMAAAAGAEATTLTYIMMITNQLEQQRRFLSTIEDRVLLGLPRERVEINKAIADNVRSVDEQRSALNVIVSELGRIRETKALIPPHQSESPVGPKRWQIMMISVLAGLMLGVLATFFTEFLLKVRKEAGTGPG